MSAHPLLVVMGPAGTGKSTVAALLASRLGWDFQEGDDLHPAENVAKMAAGHPLDDADRAPWLGHIAAWIDGQKDAGRPGIVTCSALLRRYRDVLRREHVIFVLPTGDPALVRDRMSQREGHFMPTALLDSQFAALEMPGADERTIRVALTLTPEEQADEVLRQLALTPAA